MSYNGTTAPRCSTSTQRHDPMVFVTIQLNTYSWHKLQMKLVEQRRTLSCNAKAVKDSFDAKLPMLLVLQQLAVSTGQCVTGFTEKLQWLLLVNGTENRALP